jgi:Putative phage tail protein
MFVTIGAAIASAIGLTGTLTVGLLGAQLSIAGALVAGTIAAGLTMITAKAMGGNVPSYVDSGVKVQLPPGTNNKVQKLYGRNFTGGIIIDAEIKNQNKTMAYALVLSEYKAGETWTVNKIYRGDTELVFGTSTQSHIVVSGIDPNATSTNAIGIDAGKKAKYPNGRLRCRVYAGGSSSTNQIFPTTNKVDAYGTGTGQFNNWTSANTMEDLVFAIFECDYDPDNNIVGLDAVTFDIQNSLSEPSNVLLAYLRNDRYGVNLSNTFIDTDSFNAWYTYANASVNYIDSSNTTVSHARYSVDGALNTFDPVKTNIDKICQAGGAFLTYNNKNGKFGVVVSRAATAGKITLSSTDLFSMYNQIEAEYPSVIQRDQTDTVFIETPSGDRNPNEPDNKMTYRLAMVNDRARAINLSNIDLRQGRFSTVLQFRADYEALQVDVGDVVKVTNSTYAYSDKLFRVMRTVEVEDPDGMLSVDLTLLEYDDTVYDHTVENSDTPPGTMMIPNWWVFNNNANITVGNITVADNVIYGSNANIYNPNTGNVVANINIDTAINNANINFGNTVPWVNIPIKIPANTTFDTAVIEVIDTTNSNNNTDNGVVTTVIKPPGESRYFDPDSTIDFVTNIRDFNNLKGGSVFAFQVHLADSVSKTKSNVVTTSNIPINVQNIIDNTQLAPFGAGGQFVEGNQFANVANSTTYSNVATASYNLQGVEQGVYNLDSSAYSNGLYGLMDYDVGFRTNVRVKWSNATSTVNVTYGGGGVEFVNTPAATPPPLIFDNTEIILDAVQLNAIFPTVAVDMEPQTANIWTQGYIYGLGSDGTTPREFADVKHNLFKVTSAER